MIMTTEEHEIAQEYKDALATYVHGAGEHALQHAYDLGRRAIARGLGSLDLAMIHHDALADVLDHEPAVNDVSHLTKLGSTFFAETLVPIEMTHRGFRDAVATLRASEERFRTLVETAHDVIYTLSNHGTILSLNPAFAIITGWSSEVWTGKSFVGLIHHDDLEFAVATFERVIRGEVPPVHELRILRQDGGHVVGEFRTVPQFQNRKIIGALGIARDVTDRKKQEKRIRDQAALLDIARDAIVVCDLQDRVTFWNKGAEQVYGWTQEEISGMQYYDLMQSCDHRNGREPYRHVLDHGFWTGDLQQKSKEGKNLIVESRWTLVRDAEQRATAVLIVGTNVTERRVMEARFHRAQRMESLGTLASGIAHDLNDVLAPLLLGVQALGRALPEPRYREIVTSLEATIHRGATLVSHIQMFANGAGDGKAVIGSVRLLRDLAEFVQETFPKTISVKFSVPDDLWPIRGDITRIRQAMLELCIKARDAMPGGGVLSVSAENKTLDEQFARTHGGTRPGPYVSVMISSTSPVTYLHLNDGPPDPEKGGNHRTTQDMKDDPEGIVRAHEGFMAEVQEPGRGATVIVAMPAMEPASVKQDEGERREFLAGHGEWVLVVDDESAIREITRESLQTCGYNVLTASDGAEAVAIYAENLQKIRVVLTDISMPYMGGDSAIRAIRELNAKACIIATSGVTSEDRLRELTGFADVAYLAKPYTADRLISAIDRALKATEERGDPTP